jgi:hypothetical protein
MSENNILSNAHNITTDISYRKPQQTYQEKLTYDDIKDKLKNYIKVKDIASIPLYTHIRYIEKKLNPLTQKIEQKFRLGGYLINNKNCDKYIVLSNGRLKWSVQVNNSIFYMNTKKKDEETIPLNEKSKYEKEINELKIIIAEQELKIKKLKEKNKELKKINK